VIRWQQPFTFLALPLFWRKWDATHQKETGELHEGERLKLYVYALDNHNTGLSQGACEQNDTNSHALLVVWDVDTQGPNQQL